MRPRQKPERIAGNRAGRVVSKEVEQRVHREGMNSLGRQPRAALGAVDGVRSVDFLAATAAPLRSPGVSGQEHRHGHHTQHNKVPFVKTRGDSRHAHKHGAFPLNKLEQPTVERKIRAPSRVTHKSSCGRSNEQANPRTPHCCGRRLRTARDSRRAASD